MNSKLCLQIQWSLIFVTFLTTYVWAICIGSYPTTCLTEMDTGEANEALEYILGKYEQIDMKITGDPIDVHGKRIIRGSNEELHITFKYVDNTPLDILQYCTFILRIQQGECERIQSVCNTFLARTPRPLLVRDTLTICNDESVPQIATSTEFSYLDRNENTGSPYDEEIL